MTIKDLEHHKKALHEISEQIKQLRKDSGLPKRSGDDIILHKLLKNYQYWIARTKTNKNIHRAKYARKRIKTFYRLEISKAFHQGIVVALMKNSKGTEVKS